MSTRAPKLRDLDFRRLLDRCQIRVTEQRLALLRELARVRAPISHPELTERMAKSTLDRATIYRNLLTMTEAGLLIRTQLGDQVWRYELLSSTTQSHHAHPHFVCTDCGDVACLAENAVQLRGVEMRSRVTEVQVRGLCPACDRVQHGHA